MDLISLGKQCVTEAMRAINDVSAEIVQFKGLTKNVQITADLIAQEKIVDILKQSGEDFLVVSEETEKPIQIGASPKIEVYVDPLDGSSFFLTGHKRFCCTALMFIKDEEVLGSFVGDLMTGDIYHCDTQFAYFNDQKISLSSEKKGERYMVAMYAPKGPRIRNELPKFAELAQEKILIFNNAGPLEQAFITTGQFDAVVDLLPIDLWDCCGAAIAKKAGAIVTTREGKPFQYKNIKQTCLTARNQELHKMLSSVN